MTRYEHGFISKCAEYDVDPEVLIQLANRKIVDEGKYQRRRRYAKNIVLGLAGAILGSGAGRAYAGAKDKDPNLGTALGAVAGGLAGIAGGELNSRAREYFGLDPVLPSIATTRK